MMKRLAILALFLMPGLAWGATLTSVASGVWSAHTTWDTTSDPCDGDAIIIAAGHTVVLDKDLSGWTTGVAGLTITGHNTTPGVLEPNYATAGTYYIKIKTGTTVNGSSGAVTEHGRLLANSDGVWANTTALPNTVKFVIDCLGTSYVDATHLSINLRHTDPANKYVTTYGAGTLDTVVSIASDVITTTANAPADTTAVKLTCSGAYPTGLNATDMYYVRDSTGAGKTMKLALQSGGTAVSIGTLGAVTLQFFQGYAAGSATVSCLEDVSADAPWSVTDGYDYCVLADAGPADYDQQRVSLVTITGGATPSLELSAVTDSAQYPGARVYLMARNIQIRSAGTSSTQAIVSAGTSCNIGACLINTAGTGTTFYGYGTNAGTTNAISGTVSGCSNGVYAGSGNMISGTVSGCNNGVYYGSGHTISGATFAGNTYDLRILVMGALFNTLLQASTENYQYNTNSVPAWSYVESFSHDANDGQFRSWTRGGIVNSTLSTAPTGYTVSFKHTCEKVTMECFRQEPFSVEPGDSLSIKCYMKIPATDLSAWPPRLMVIDDSNDPLVDTSATALATVQIPDADGSDTSWQQLPLLTYSNAGTLPKRVQIRASYKHASVVGYEVWDVIRRPFK